MNPRATVVINQSLAASNTFTVDLNSLGVRFPARGMIVRQLLYANIAGADNGIYLLWSSLTGTNIAAVYVGIQGVALTPQSEFTILTFNPTVEFRLTGANAAYTGPTGNLTMTLEFY